MTVVISDLDRNNTDKQYIRKLAELHMSAFPNFFLTQLGRSFLMKLYEGYLEDPNSGVIVAEDNGDLVGFIAYSNDYSDFYSTLKRKHLFSFAFSALGAAIRHPSFIKRLFGALTKDDEVRRTDKYVELASICVDTKSEGKGIGSELISYLKNKVDFKTYKYINLETDAENNERANKFYLKNGFTLDRTYLTREGRKMNEYHLYANT